jgi:hypothetical protein
VDWAGPFLEADETVVAVMVDARLLPDSWWKVLPYEKCSIVVTKRRVLFVRTSPFTNRPIALDPVRGRADVWLVEDREVFAKFGGEGGESFRRVVLSVGGEDARFNARDARMVIQALRYPCPGAP